MFQRVSGGNQEVSGDALCLAFASLGAFQVTQWVFRGFSWDSRGPRGFQEEYVEVSGTFQEASGGSRRSPQECF